MSESIWESLPGLSRTAQIVIRRAGARTMRRLVSLTAADITRYSWHGVRVAAEIQAALEKKGLSLRIAAPEDAERNPARPKAQ